MCENELTSSLSKVIVLYSLWMSAFSYGWSLPGTWYKDGGHTRRSVIAKNPMIHANHMALSFVEPIYGRSKFYIAGIRIFDLFGFYDLNLGPMTFIYDLDPYSMEIHRMCKYELLTSSSPESSSPSLVSLKCTSINQSLILRPENLTSCLVVKWCPLSINFVLRSCITFYTAAAHTFSNNPWQNKVRFEITECNCNLFIADWTTATVFWLEQLMPRLVNFISSVL